MCAKINGEKIKIGLLRDVRILGQYPIPLACGEGIGARSVYPAAAAFFGVQGGSPSNPGAAQDRQVSPVEGSARALSALPTCCYDWKTKQAGYCFVLGRSSCSQVSR